MCLQIPAILFGTKPSSHLKRLDQRLWFEVSEPDGSDREFVITAEGHAAAFPLVDAIVAAAPQIPGWRFISLKPPMGFDFVTTYENIQFDPRTGFCRWRVPRARRISECASAFQTS